MKSRIIAVLVACAGLVGCNDEGDDTMNASIYDHYGTWYTHETPLGIRYRDDTGMSEDDNPANDMPTAEFIDESYMHASICANTWVDPRVEHVLVIRTAEVPEWHAGFIWYPELIVYLPLNEAVIKHEFLHFLLYHSGQDESHNNPSFELMDSGMCN